ncbi:SGNH/GDSL hydrolase family protein [Microvirga brassicacearum]|uniref:SGNH/GDSL hydrolase family protein n=1 Tax=Microvirga brassicacearum TaxID=2580413 RepID=A0A5N3P4I6_9HYPH|nr:SGNH/GDSL hydrolase family protein [Microvirga brassicacearum]KAB0264646.1 SGNH/GDSL hydrolase family protein [Microvirga brassicacearum]
MRAVDGAVSGDVERQLGTIAGDADYLIVSAGGNDGLPNISLLREAARSVAEVMGKLTAVYEDFAARYGEMVSAIMEQRLPVALCTIYDGRFPDPRE